MIPKLYESNETEFKTNGLGSLSDAISCKVTEERNGAFELEMEYPVGGLHYDLIESNRIIYAKPNETSEPQPFDIKEVTLSMDGMKATIYAQHMRYRLNGVPVKPFSATGITNALQGLVDNALIKMGFTVWTDINNTSSKFELKEPNTFGQLLGGTDGSILDVFSGSSGCEYEFDKKAIKLWAHRGSDNGVTIRYGKNLKGCKMETNIESVYTGVLAYWTKEDDGTTTSIQGDIQYIDNHDKYPREQIYLLDCSSDYTEQPSTSELNAKAKAYGTNNNIGEPSVSADVEFYQLWQTEEYKNVAPLERVSLCDTVHVIFRELGCDVSAIVNKTVYDTLLERYDAISVGSVKSKLGDTVKQVAHDVYDEQNKEIDSWVQDQITQSADKIRGGTNGHVVMKVNANGETNELYAFDGDSLETATKVLRLNYEGIAGSANGFNGKYSLAITTDGTINANQITSGTIKAIAIEGSSISGGTISGTTIKGSTISGNTISGGTISGTTISGTTLKGSTITFGTDKTLTMSGTSEGSQMIGEGKFTLNSVDGFNLTNFKDSERTIKLNSLFVIKSGTNGIALQNYQSSNSNVIANYIYLKESDTSGISMCNYFTGSDYTANYCMLQSSSTGAQQSFANYYQNKQSANRISMNSYNNEYAVLSLTNRNPDGTMAGEIQFKSDGTDSLVNTLVLRGGNGNGDMWIGMSQNVIKLRYANYEDRFELNNESAIMRHANNWISVSNSNAIQMYTNSKCNMWISDNAVYATNGHTSDSGTLFNGRVPIVTGFDKTHAVELYWTGSVMQVYVDGTHQKFE